VLAGTLALASISFLGAIRGGRRACAVVLPPNAPVLAWRPEMPEVERLRRCLDAAHGALARGAVVGFASPEGPPGSAFFRRLWAAYLAPDLNLLSEGDAQAHARWIIACGEKLDRPGVSLVRALPAGGLYRIGPP
jgi:hypothetical protein